MNSIRIALGVKDGARVRSLRLEANRTHADEREVVRLRIAEMRRDAMKTAPRGGSFICVCGPAGYPCDPAFEAMHRELLKRTTIDHPLYLLAALLDHVTMKRSVGLEELLHRAGKPGDKLHHCSQLRERDRLLQLV